MQAMSDSQSCDICDKLGFDSANRWLLYDDQFKKLFSFISENITDSNILSEQEVLECDELVQRGKFLSESELRMKLQRLESEQPGLVTCKEDNVNKLLEEVALLEQAEGAYAKLLDDMRITKSKVNGRLASLEDSINEILYDEKDLLANCQRKATQLEELQRENLKLCQEALKCCTQIQSPPLFVHQLPLDQYLNKCDLFLQHFTLYIKENFKIQEEDDPDQSALGNQRAVTELHALQKSIKHYTMKCIKEKAKVKATQMLIDQLDPSKIHVSLDIMERETDQLQTLKDHLDSEYEIQLNDLAALVDQYTQQHVELVLYGNTQVKIARANQRYEGASALAQIISDSLLNAELLWIILQLDMEKTRNRFDNTKLLHAEAAACRRRMAAMQQRASKAAIDHNGCANVCGLLLSQMSESLSLHLGNGQKIRPEIKAFLYQYEKFSRLLNDALRGMLNKKAYRPALEKLRELDHLENILRPYVFDSPVVRPMLENVRLLQPIFKANLQQAHIDEALCQLFRQFQEYTDYKAKNKFWRNGRLLWIWFLTDPKRVLKAIEEVKRAAAKAPSMTVKMLGGIKRK